MSQSHDVEANVSSGHSAVPGVTLSTELAIVYPAVTDILEYLRDDHEANPVKLVCRPNPTVFST